MLQWIRSLVGQPSKDRFAHQLMDLLRTAGKQRHLIYDSTQCRIEFFEDGESIGILNLGNFYAEYRQTPRAERAAFMQRVVRGALSYQKELPDEFQDAKHDLRPAVRTRSYCELLRFPIDDEKNRVPYIELAEHLCAYIVYDLPEGMHFVTQGQLDDWGVTLYEALEVAKQNLTETEASFARIGDGVYVSATGDCYDASRLLMLDLIRSMTVTGDTIAMVANRDWLVVTGSEDTVGLGLMAKIASDKLAEARPLSGIAMKLDGDEWVEWMPPASYECFEKFKELQLRSMAMCYDDQKAAMDEIAEKNGTDQFVASYSVASKDNKLFSYCVWTKDLDSLLPRADRVMFFCPERQLVADGSWQHVQSVVGELMASLDIYPPRYRVTGFPTDEQLEQIHQTDAH